MAEVRSSRVWTRQPQSGVGLNWSNPITRQIAFAWNAQYARQEQVTGAVASTNNTTALGSVNGLARRSATGQVNLEWNRQFFTTSNGAGTGDFTMLVYANPTTAGSGSAQHVFVQKNDAGGSPFAQAAIFAHADQTGAYQSGTLCFFTYNATTTPGDSGVAQTSAFDGNFHVFVGRRVGNVLSLWKDGRLVTSSSLTLRSITQASPSRYTAIGSRGNGSTDSFDRDALCAFAWNRGLSDGEIAELSLNPWQLFAPQRQVSYFLPPPPSALEITPVMQRMPMVWTRQPVGRALIAENYKRDLLFAYTPWDNVLSTDGQRKSYSGTMPPLAAGKAGVVGSFTNPNFIDISGTGGLVFNNGISFVIVAKRNQVTVTNGALFGRGTTGAGRINIGFTSTTISQLCTDATSTQFGPTKSYVNGTDDTTPAIVTTVNDYYVIATKFPAVPGNGQPLAVGRWGGTGSYGNVNIALCAMWPRQLSDAELQSLSLNPWQLFAPQRQVTYSLPTAPSAVQTKTVMRVVPRSRVQTQQPQGPVRLDPKYGAVAGVYGSMVWDAASGQSTTIDTNGVSTAVYAGSLGKKFTGSGTGSVKTVILQDTAAYTYVFNAILAGAGSSGLGRPLSTFNGTGGHDLFFSSSSLRIQEWFSTLRGEWYINQNTFFYTPKTFVVSYDASSASNIPRVWVDGRQSTVFVNTTPSGSRISGGLTLGIGNRPDTTARQLDGVMLMAAMLPYAANDGLAQSLSLNPWQLFAPQSQIIYSLASVKPSLSSAAATSITNTTATPQVTLNL